MLITLHSYFLWMTPIFQNEKVDIALRSRLEKDDRTR